MYSKYKSWIKNYCRLDSLWVIVAITTILISVIAVLVITMLMNNRFNESINHSTQQNNSQVVINVADSIDSYIHEMITITDTVTDILNQGDEIDNNLHSTHFFLRDDIDTIAVFRPNGEVVLKTDNREIKPYFNLMEQDWFRSVAPGSNYYTLSSPHVQRLYSHQYPWVISLSKGVQWKNSIKESQQGIVLVDMNFNNIKELCSKELGENGYLYILGNDKKIIYHPHMQMIYAGIITDDVSLADDLEDGNSILETKDGRLSVSIKSLKNAEWKIVGVSNMRGFFSDDEEIQRFIAVIICSVILIIILLAAIVSFTITRPMRRLMLLMGRVEEGELDTVSHIQGVYEAKALSHSFNQMVYRIKLLMDEVKWEQKQLRKSEMKTLQEQINPHFLYNTLDSIIWMAESGDQQNVIKMIDALACFFRLSLSGGKEIITVEGEINHTKNYLVIQKMRYSDQFDYVIEVDENVLKYKTLKIILQPIVENAIIHGVANLPYEGEIKISCKIDGNFLIFRVVDNGFGIKPDMLKKILEVKPSSKSGVGIRNVHQRIQLMYGIEYGLEYESEPDEGTQVTIRLPIIE